MKLKHFSETISFHFQTNQIEFGSSQECNMAPGGRRLSVKDKLQLSSIENVVYLRQDRFLLLESIGFLYIKPTIIVLKID